jgi:hypothetical protein
MTAASFLARRSKLIPQRTSTMVQCRVCAWTVPSMSRLGCRNGLTNSVDQQVGAFGEWLAVGALARRYAPLPYSQLDDLAREAENL